MHLQTVLLIEDDPNMAYLLKFVLEREGFAVEHLPDGQQAREFMQSRDKADLVIMDLMLPYVDGFDLLRWMRDHEPWCHAPRIVLSAREQESDVVKAFESGADDYVKKPFSPAELMSRVRRHIGRAGQTQQAPRA